MNSYPGAIAIVFTIVIAGLTWWLGDVVHRWPQRVRRRISDGPIVPIGQDAPRARQAVEQLAEVNARTLGGVPLWQIRAVFELADVKLDTHADVSRWLLIIGSIEKRTREARRLLDTKREQLRLYGEEPSDRVPDFLRTTDNDVA